MNFISCVHKTSELSTYNKTVWSIRHCLFLMPAKGMHFILESEVAEPMLTDQLRCMPLMQFMNMISSLSKRKEILQTFMKIE